MNIGVSRGDDQNNLKYNTGMSRVRNERSRLLQRTNDEDGESKHRCLRSLNSEFYDDVNLTQTCELKQPEGGSGTEMEKYEKI